MPRVIGDCKEFTERWYYDEADEECRAFLFGGCNGNANNFDSMDSCNQRCKSTVSPIVPESAKPIDEDFRTGRKRICLLLNPPNFTNGMLFVCCRILFPTEARRFL